MNYKKILVSAAAIVILLVIGIFLSRPILLKAVLAKYKSTDHFVTLAEDARIRYEPGAKDKAAAVKEILDGSQKNVESLLKAHFKKPIDLYVCASQVSFNGYVFLSKNVKGAVYWGKLFLSPRAFSQGEAALAEVTTHELTHYLFHTYLGEQAHIEHIPLWFREGIAVYVANGGPAYTEGKNVRDVISDDEKEAYLSGATNAWFASKNPGDAVGKNGTANWLLYRVGALFVHYLHDSQPAQFDRLVQLLLSGSEFTDAVNTAYGKNVELLHKEFAQFLTAKNS